VDSIFSLPGHLLNGFLTALSPVNLAFGLIGVTVGTAIGVLPGIGPALTISLLLPLTYGLDPTTAFIMFGGIYYGAMYGGSTTSILVKMPGEAASVVTSLDGFQMAKQGRAGAALATAAIGSFVAGTFATFMLMLVAPILVNLALRFGPPEYFALMVLALTTVSGLSGGSAPRAMFSTMLGLGLGIVGIDLQSGQARLTFGIPSLLSGIDVVVAAIGFFAVGEVLWAAATRERAEETVSNVGRLKMTEDDWRRSWPAWIRGSLIGFFVGVLPGAGATVSTFLSYSAERNASKYPAEFGKGAIEGVAGPEAANNASAGGSIVPLLALGIPGGGTTAIMLAAFQLYGLQPGPLLFAEKPQLVWGLIASLYISNVLLLALNLPLVGIWVKLLQVPQPLLFGSVLAFSMLGVYTINHNSFDLLVVWILGIVSFFMRRYDFPIAPAILGLVLGPLLEQEFRKSVAISVGDPMIFFTRPISAVILLVASVILLSAVRARSKALPSRSDDTTCL
jgi:putative tricarboxylic transport membrane protein